MDLIKLSLIEIKKLLDEGKVSSLEVTKQILNRVEEHRHYNTLITSCNELALEKAKSVDERRAKGEKLGALAGIPLIVKDNLSTEGIKTTCASKFLENYVPVFDATVIKKLKEADAVIIGKANMDEFAMGSTTENSAYGPTLNAVDITRAPGGSSGGSASAVADFQCYGALGSDTGGSIRQPASFCGIVGLKPTYSVVSRYGLIAFASSLDQIGPLTRTVRDSASLLNVIAGYDKLDSTSANISENYEDYTPTLKGKTLGVVKEFLETDILDEGVRASIEDTIKICERAGAIIKEVSLGAFDAAIATYYVLGCAEATSNLARFDGIKYGTRVEGEDYIDSYYRSRTSGFGEEVKRRIMTGNYVLSSGYYDAYYLKASKIRTRIKADFEKALSMCDVILGPTAPTPATKLGVTESDSTKIYYSDVYTVLSNIAGNPSISIPCGKDKQGLPVGLQLIGNFYGEKDMLSVAEGIEREVR